MTFELLPLLGVEGIVIFSLILLVSIGLAGFRLSAAGTNGQIDNGRAAGSLLRVRQRLATRTAEPDAKSGRRSRIRDAVQLSAWIIAAARNEAAKSFANQSMIGRQRAAPGGVKVFPAAVSMQSVDERVLVDDHCAGVSENEPYRMDSEAQWTRVNKIATEGLGKAKEIESLHEAAARQLDAVDYAYERMLLELRDVLPGVVETRSVCRTNREADYAAVSAGDAEPSDSETAALVSEIPEQAGLEQANGSVSAPKAAASRARARKTQATESAAA